MVRRYRIVATLVAVVALAAAGGRLRAQDTILTGTAAYGDWTKDAPGVWRELVPADMPSSMTKATASISKLVPAPPNAVPHVLPGFSIAPLVSGLMHPRVMRIAPNGDLFFNETGQLDPKGIGVGIIHDTGRISI